MSAPCAQPILSLPSAYPQPTFSSFPAWSPRCAAAACHQGASRAPAASMDPMASTVADFPGLIRVPVTKLFHSRDQQKALQALRTEKKTTDPEEKNGAMPDGSPPCPTGPPKRKKSAQCALRDSEKAPRTNKSRGDPPTQRTGYWQPVCCR